MDETVPAVEEPNVWVVECRNRYKCPKCNRGRNTDTQLGWEYCPFCGSRNVFKESKLIKTEE